MNLRIAILVCLLVCTLSGSYLCAQQPSSAVQPSVPRQIRFSGSLKNNIGNAMSGQVGITFSLYKDQEGGSALWTENQTLPLDANGRYNALLGSTLANGLPVELFTSGEARWLGVQPDGQAEQTRVLLLSVPYALKAADAETIGGLPASAFVLASPANVTPPVSSTVNAAPPTSATAPPPATVTGSGTPNFVPLWTSASAIGNSVLFQLGTGGTAKVGINTTTPAATLDVRGGGIVRGTLQLPSLGTATATAGFNSNPTSWTASAFNSSTAAAVNQLFQWQSEPAGNNTANPSGTLNLLFASGTNKPAETGLKISNKGLFTFATGQTFPGVGTITGVTTATGSGLTGGGTTGTLTLSLLKTCTTNQTLQWNGTAWACASAGAGTITGVTAGNDLTGGGTSGTVTLNLDTTKVPLLASANTFAVGQTVKGNVTLSGTGNGVVFADGTKQTTAATGGGSITGVTAGTDLTGGGTTGNVTLNLDTTKVPQLAANNTFSGTQTVLGNLGVTGVVSGTGSFGGGVTASTVTDADFVTGILGEQLAVTRAGIGVEGFGNSLLGVGVYGNTYTQSNEGAGLSAAFPLGVWGDTGLTGGISLFATADQGGGVVAVNNSATYITGAFQNDDVTATGTVLEAIGTYGNNGFGGYCTIDVNGSLICNGFLSAVAPVNNGQQQVALYGMQSPENWFEDFGSGQLSNGIAIINLEAVFAQTVNTNTSYHVFLTPNGDSRGLFIAQKTPTSFEVREQGGGASNIAFDYRIVARRKGFETVRLADQTAQFQKSRALLQKKRTTPLRIPNPRRPSSSTSAALNINAVANQAH